MLVKTIYNALVGILQNDTTLKTYVKYVFKGKRLNIEPDSFPCIMVEPTSNEDVLLEINVHKKIWFKVNIYGYLYNAIDPEVTIIGNTNYKGIFDIEQDIKKALASSYTLNDTAIDVQFDTTEFTQDNNVPVRGVTIPCKVLYSQTNYV